jgi:prepilin-type N-terminal cleavage/methylation domain-containing protein
MQKLGFPGKNKAKEGFTLVELLVVIGIITVLVGILLPALSKARAASKNVVCLSNLQHLGQGFAIYADQYKGWWPAPATPNTTPSTFWHRDYIYPILFGHPVLAGQVTDNTFIANSIFECPAADQRMSNISYMTPITEIDATDQQQFSYGMSSRLCDMYLGAAATNAAHVAINGDKNCFKNVAKIQNTSLTCLLIDSVGSWAGTINDGSAPNVDSQWARLQAALYRHSPPNTVSTQQYSSTTINTAASRAQKNQFLNVLYADYHAAPISYFDIPKAVDINGANATAPFYQFWCGSVCVGSSGT